MNECTKPEEPRVLIAASEPLNFFLGAGITMSSLFRGWARHDLASVYWKDIRPDVTLTDRFFSLKGMQPPSEDLDAWVKDFNPHVIYCVVTDQYGIDLVNHLADATGAAIALHVYDDWVSVVGMQRRNVLAALWERRSTVAKFNRLVNRARVRLAIGDKMAQEYERRYGHHFLWFQNAPESEVWVRQGKHSWESSLPHVIRFTGNIYALGNLAAVMEVARAVEVMCKRGVEARLEIYTTDDNIQMHKEKFSPYLNTSLCQTVEGVEEMAKLNGNADVLLLAYNFDRQASRWLGYSMPTKLPSSMLSGTPIFVYAPSSSSVADYLSQTESGYVVSNQQSAEDLATKLEECCSNAELRKRLGTTARGVALREMSADSVRPRFERALKESADSGR